MFRGKYQKLTSSGVAEYYSTGDTVLFEGNLYENLIPTSLSPFAEPNSWKYKGLYNLYSGSNPPIKPKLGQLWQKDGKIYTYFFDGSNNDWVQF
jgi:hypothetical protein